MKKHVLSVLAVTLCSGPVPANVETKVLLGKRGGNTLPYVAKAAAELKKLGGK